MDSIRPSFNRYVLKNMALVTMLFDHVGATLALSLYRQSPTEFHMDLYYALRIVGRLSFPIFCFFLVEGFDHTRKRTRYALRLGAFALLSEIPFDMAFRHPANGFLEFDRQNVFFTLELGLLALCLWDALARQVPRKWRYFTLLPAAIPSYIAAERLHTDYASFGVLLIVALGAGRGLPKEGLRPHTRLLQAALGSLAILYYCYSHQYWLEIYAVFGLLLCLCYNGERGRGSKWFFYWFYPTHLLALALINRAVFR